MEEHCADYENEDYSLTNCNDGLHNDEADLNEDIEDNGYHREEESKDKGDDRDEDIEDNGLQREANEEDKEDATLKNMLDLTMDDMLGMEFDIHDMAYQFYVKYARCVGFGVRKATTSHDEYGNLARRRFVCCCQGLREAKHYNKINRKRDEKPETRTNCKATLYIYHEKSTRKWKVSRVREDHNHDLTPSKRVHLIVNHRGLTDADKAQINSMVRHGFPTTRIRSFMASQAGGYGGVGFRKKDLFNYLEKENRA